MKNTIILERSIREKTHFFFGYRKAIKRVETIFLKAKVIYTVSGNVFIKNGFYIVVISSSLSQWIFYLFLK